MATNTKDLVGRTFNTQIFVNSGLAESVLVIDEQPFYLTIGELEGAYVIPTPGINPGKYWVRVNQIDPSNSDQTLLAEIIPTRKSIHDFSRDIHDFLIAVPTIADKQEYASRFAVLERELRTTEPKNDKEAKNLDKLRNRFETAKTDLLARLEENEILTQYTGGEYRVATPADIPAIGWLSKGFYEQAVIPGIQVDISDIIGDAKKQISHYSMYFKKDKPLAFLGYSFLDGPDPKIKVPYMHSIGAKHALPKVIKQVLIGAMGYLKMNELFTELRLHVDNPEFYRQAGFVSKGTYKEHTTQDQRTVKKTLIHFRRSDHLKR